MGTHTIFSAVDIDIGNDVAILIFEPQDACGDETHQERHVALDCVGWEPLHRGARTAGLVDEQICRGFPVATLARVGDVEEDEVLVDCSDEGKESF